MNFLAVVLQSQPDNTDALKVLALMGPLFAVVVLVCLAIVMIPFWFICKKAGFSPWLTLLNVVPMGNLVLLYVLAFAEWKVVPATQMVPYPPQYPPQYPPVPPTA